MTFFQPHYVKVGITGYGPDLEPEDEPYDDVAAMCSAIRDEISTSIDMLAENWSLAKANGDAEEYMKARELADELEGIAASLDYAQRSTAPMYRNAWGSLNATMLGLVEQHFPLVVDVDGNHKIYVWEASE
jgi:hypothetical protein